LTSPTVSIIIVNFNGADFLSTCLDSVFNQNWKTSYEVIIVDNYSQDNSLEVLDHYKTKITLIKNSQNHGFAFANNQAAQIAIGSYLLLLNNDTKLLDHSLDKLVTFHNSHPDIGGVGPKLLNEDGSLQAQGSRLGWFKFKTTEPKKMSFISFAAFLISKALYLQAGGLDENLFFYNDDVDLCTTLRRQNHPIYYLPTTEVIHFGGLSTKFRKKESIIEGYNYRQ